MVIVIIFQGRTIFGGSLSFDIHVIFEIMRDRAGKAPAEWLLVGMSGSTSVGACASSRRWRCVFGLRGALLSYGGGGRV